jgi:hypothetical protein
VHRHSRGPSSCGLQFAISVIDVEAVPSTTVFIKNR